MNCRIHSRSHFSKCSFQWMAFQPSRVKFCLQKVASTWQKPHRQAVVVHSNTKRDCKTESSDCSFKQQKDAFDSKDGKFTIYFTINLAPFVQRVGSKNIHCSSCNWDLAQLVWRLDDAIQQITHYPLDTNYILLYRCWWNARISPLTKKSYLHSAQWRYYFYLSRERILLWPWLWT
mgnify:CR=1 FL=1